MRPSLPLLLVALVALCACSSNASADDPNQRLIDIYSAAIPTVVTHENPDLSADEPLDQVIFVATREGVGIPFEVQVGVVNQLEPWANIRFIDDFDEALTGDQEDRTVREGGVLIQLGAVSAGTTAVTVDADRYEGPGRLLAFDLELLRRAGEWVVDEPVSATAVTLVG